MNEKQNNLRPYPVQEQDKSILFSGRRLISDITLDHQGRIWLCSVNGLLLGIETDHKLSIFDQSSIDSTVNLNVTFGITEDSRNQIWVYTDNSGIALYQEEDQSFIPIQHHPFNRYSLSSNQVRSVFEDRQGNMSLYFGSSDGITVFNPTEFNIPRSNTAVVLTTLTVNNASITAIDDNNILDKTTQTAKGIRLDYTHSSFSLDFSLLNYRGAKYNRYAHFLEGFDKHWSAASRTNRATYTNIPAGNYILRTQGMDWFNQWSDNQTAIEIHIAPSPWIT